MTGFASAQGPGLAFEQAPTSLIEMSDAMFGGARLPSVAIAPPGHPIRVVWSPVAGASKAQVDSALAQLESALIEQQLDDLVVNTLGKSRVVTIPNDQRIGELTLHGLKLADDVELRSEADLRKAGRRLVVSIPGPDGWSPPLFAIPAVPARGMIPPSLTGATFANRVLSFPFPGLSASHIRVTVVQRDVPEQFEQVDVQLDSVSGKALLAPRNPELVGPDGAAVWAFPGELPPQAPVVDIDLRFALEQALNDALASQQPLDLTFRLRGAAPGRAGFRFAGASGALLRIFPGVLRTTLAGDPVRLALGDGAPLAGELPAASADLTVRYEGIRILEAVSDPVPAPGEASGLVVADQPSLRLLPPAALGGLPLAKVGLIGRAPVACELSVQLVDASGGAAGVALGAPGVLELDATTAIGTIWVDLPPLDPPRGPLGLAVRANYGRFLWASAAAPLVRLAVRDPDPGGRPLRMAGQPIANVHSDTLHLPAQALPPAAFRSSAPFLDSDLFLTVDLSDLTLSYRR